MSRAMTMGVVVGNRGFFPDALAKNGREEMLRALERAGIASVVLGPDQSKHGAVETYEEAKRCAELFQKHRDRIDGIVVTLPNFGDERAVADTLRLAELRVPVLVQASPDTAGSMTAATRRDSFCGKISVCNNLRQYGIPFSLTARHTVQPETSAFAEDLRTFAAVCRVVGGLRHLRMGCIGARPAAFKTVRYSEKLLEASGISVETVDLAEIFGRVARLPDSHDGVRAKLQELRDYVPGAVPDAALLKMAKLGYVIAEWMRAADVTLTAVQCWTAMQEFLGVMPCTIMSLLSNGMLSSACETDICGALSMHVLTLASETPSALLDWNNNYGDDPDKVVCFHCSNLPKHFFQEARMHYGEIFAQTVGLGNAYGTVAGRIKSGPMTFARVSTDDLTGRIRGYVGAGNFTSDPLESFGGVGVAHIPRLQALMRFVCANGLEHHVAANLGSVADAVHEAIRRYLGWDIELHSSIAEAPA